MKERNRAVRQIFTGRNCAWMLLVSIMCGIIIALSMTGMDAACSSVLFFSESSAMTSGNIYSLFRSWQGYTVLVIAELILLLTAAVLFNLVILLAEDLRQGHPVHPVHLIVKSAGRIRLFLCRQGIPVILFYLIFIPALAVTIFFFIPDPFEIPGFVRYLLHKKILYRVVYILGMAILVTLQLRDLFLIHEVILEKETLPEARKKALRMVRDNRRQVYPTLAGAAAMAAAVILTGFGLFRYMPLLLQLISAPMPRLVSRYIVLFGTYLALLLLALCILLAPWIVILPLADLYDRLCGHMALKDREENCHAPDMVKSFLPALLISLLCLLIIAVGSWYSLAHFEYLFPGARQTEAVVHRLGGDLDIENTLEGQEAALEMGARAAETDIQRTADGSYIIFHDATLKRLCGREERPCDLTLDELRSIKMQTVTGEIRKIPTLEEVLDKGKGRETLYLELKGITADEQMADDVIALLREKGMDQDCVLISMNYSVIRYIDRNYPDIRCGYLYFFAYGNAAGLEADMLLSQANVIHPTRTRAIHRKGKKLYCWTVNSRKTARAMLRRRVDGIISDRYDIIQSVLDHMESRTDYERIMDVLVN